MVTRVYRTRTCQCGKEVKRLHRTPEGPRCGDCVRREGLEKLPAPKQLSRSARLAESLAAIEKALDDHKPADLGDIESLAEEMASWRDNMEGTGLEATGKFEAVGEAAEALESGKDELEGAIEEYNSRLDEIFGGDECSYCQGDCSEWEPPAEDGPEKGCDEECFHCRREGLEEVIDAVRSAAEELENVDFPGMY